MTGWEGTARQGVPRCLTQRTACGCLASFHPQQGIVGRGRTSLLGGAYSTVLWVEAPGRQGLEVPRKHLFVASCGKNGPGDVDPRQDLGVPIREIGLGRGGTELRALAFLPPIPEIPRFSIGQKKPLSPGHRLFPLGWAPLLPSQPTSPAQTKSSPPGFGCCQCLISPSPAWPQTPEPQQGQGGGAGRLGTGYWVIRVGGEVAGIQAGATNSGVPPGGKEEADPGGISAPHPCLPTRQMVFI